MLFDLGLCDRFSHFRNGNSSGCYRFYHLLLLEIEIFFLKLCYVQHHFGLCLLHFPLSLLDFIPKNLYHLFLIINLRLYLLHTLLLLSLRLGGSIARHNLKMRKFSGSCSRCRIWNSLRCFRYFHWQGWVQTKNLDLFRLGLMYGLKISIFLKWFFRYQNNIFQGSWR